MEKWPPAVDGGRCYGERRCESKLLGRIKITELFDSV